MTTGTNISFPIIQNFLVWPKFIQSILKCIHSQCWVSYFLKVTCYSYKLLYFMKKVTCYSYLLHFFKSNLLQLLLHFKSNKLLYKLLCRYFITSLKLQGFKVLFQLQISTVIVEQVKYNDQHQNCIKHLI